jgi:hypothetical protein
MKPQLVNSVDNMHPNTTKRRITPPLFRRRFTEQSNAPDSIIAGLFNCVSVMDERPLSSHYRYKQWRPPLMIAKVRTR